MVSSCADCAHFSIYYFSQPLVSRLNAVVLALSRARNFTPSKHLDRVKFRLVSF